MLSDYYELAQYQFQTYSTRSQTGELRQKLKEDVDKTAGEKSHTKEETYLAQIIKKGLAFQLRCSEVRNLKHSDIKDGYIRIVHGKGSLGELTRISKRLQAAIDSAKAINTGAPTPITGAFLLHDAKGLKIQKNAFDSAWQRVMEKATEIGLQIEGRQLKLEEGFKFHDLKAKGVSDHTEHHSGHKSEKARQIYIRKLQQVDATR